MTLHAPFEEIVSGLEGLGQIDAPGIDPERPMVFQLRQQGIDERTVIGPAADKEFAFRLHGIAVELLTKDESRDQQNRQARKKDIEQSFFTHLVENFCKDIKNSYFCAG